MVGTSDTWRPIEDFPGYIINMHGDTSSDRWDRKLIHTPGRKGMPTVGLTRDGKQHRRSVAKLVAEAFLDPPIREDFDTVTHLDGDRSNCYYENLMWRPRWFAIRYHQCRQRGIFDGWNQPIMIVETGEVFETMIEPAMKYGLIDNDISASLWNGTQTFPHGFHFAWA